MNLAVTFTIATTVTIITMHVLFFSCTDTHELRSGPDGSTGNSELPCV